MREQELSLPELFIDTQRLLHRYHMIQHHKEENGFDPRQGQGRILALLKKVQNITQKELAYLLNIRQQSLGELLRKLEQGGYIMREPAPKDKRAMIVSLTDKGKALEFKELDFQEVFSCLDETAQENMKRYLKAISDHLNEILQDEDTASDFPVREWEERRDGTDHRLERRIFGDGRERFDRDLFGEE